MRFEEAETHIGSQVRLVLTNGFKYHGSIINVLEDTLILKDKFNSNVSIKLANILVLEEINQ